MALAVVSILVIWMQQNQICMRKSTCVAVIVRRSQRNIPVGAVVLLIRDMLLNRLQLAVGK